MGKTVRMRVHDRPLRLDGVRTRDQGPMVKAEIARFKGLGFSAESDDEGVTVYHTAEGIDGGDIYAGVGPGQLGTTEDPRGDRPLDLYNRAGGAPVQTTDRAKVLARRNRAVADQLGDLNTRNRAFWQPGAGFPR